jgi:enoyl-CoA hydratase/carnithine racemase
VTVAHEVAEGVAIVLLQRPGQHNALTPSMFAALVATGEELARRDDVRAILLAGDGPSFCSGLDFASVTDQTRPRLVAREPGSSANLVQRAALVWADAPVPVVAALHGHVLGAGLQIALAADIRIAHPSTRLCAMEIRHGLIPDMGISRTLPPLVRGDIARELILTGRAVQAPEAHALGLVTHLADTPRDTALEIATTIAGHAPAAVRAAKQLLNRAYGERQELLPMESALQDELRAGRTKPR